MKRSRRPLLSRRVPVWCLLIGFLILIPPASAASCDVTLFNATPEAGKPLTLSVAAYPLGAGERNLGIGDGTDAALSLAPQGAGTFAGEYTFTPKAAKRYVVIFTLRVDQWRLVDRRTVFVDWRQCPELVPLTFRYLVKPRLSGTYSTGDTTVLVRKQGMLTIRLATDVLAHVFPEHERLHYQTELSLQEPAPAPLKIMAKASLLDWHGRERQLEHWDAVLAPGQTVSRTVSSTPRSPGYYRFRLVVPEWGEAFLDGGVLSPPPKNDRLGINVSWSDQYTHSPDFIRGNAALLARQGVRWLRTEYEWRVIEPARGAYDWAFYDRIRDIARPLGMEMLPCLFRVPQWASRNPGAPDFFHYALKPGAVPDYGEFVANVAMRYGDWIKVYSIWNEIDSCWFIGGTAADYGDLLATCDERLKKLNPALKTTCSGVSAAGRGTAAQFFRDVLKHGGARHFDILDTHYDDRNSLAVKIGELNPYSAAGQKPVWVTEQAANQVVDRSLAAAAKHASARALSLILPLTMNPDKLFLWGDIDQHPDRLFWGQIKAEDRTVRPAFFAYATLIRLLANQRCTEIYSDTKQLRAYWFQPAETVKLKDTQGTLVLCGNADTLVFLGDVGESGELVDLMGAPLPFAVANREAFLSVGIEPFFLHLPHRPGKVRPITAFSAEEYAATPGKPVVLALSVMNPFRDPRVAAVTLVLPTAWSTDGPTTTTVPLDPGKAKEWHFSVQVPKNAIIGSVADIRARITGLAVDEVTTATVVRLTTPEGVLLIEAESAPRSQGKCPGTPMHVVDSAECSGGMAVAMFWGGAWMEYDIPFAKPGQYRLSLRAAGRFTGSPDEKRGKLLLPIAMDGNAVGELTYPDTGKMTGQTLDFVVPSSGMHTIKVEFPVDTGDIFVDYLTIEEKVERPLFPQVAPTP